MFSPGPQGAASLPWAAQACEEGSYGRAKAPPDAFGHLLILTVPGINTAGQEGAHCTSSLVLEEETKANQHEGNKHLQALLLCSLFKKNNFPLWSINHHKSALGRVIHGATQALQGHCVRARLFTFITFTETRDKCIRTMCSHTAVPD